MAPNSKPGQSDDDREKEAEKMREVAEALGDGARKIGLYMQDAGVVPGPPDPLTGEPTKVLVVNFDIGDQAFSVRVQEGTEAEKMTRNVRQLEREMAQAEFDALKERIARGEVFKPAEDEGDPE